MDYFFQEQRWTDTFLSLHVKKFKRIILFLLIAFSAAGAKAQSDVTFNDGVRYSQWVIDSRMNDFWANTTHCGFAVYDQSGNKTAKRVDGKTSLDYVVGLVAKSIIEASQYYSQFTWAESFANPWFLSIKDYGDNFYSKFETNGGSLDDLNAVKLFIPLRELTATNGTYPDAATYANTKTALDNAIKGLNAHNTNYRIKDENILAKTAGNDVLGGWWHKSDYQNQMWLDGSYMGPALFAQLVNYSGKKTNIDSSNDWDLIVKQFTILHEMCWNETDKLPYHAFAADGGTNSTSHSDTWAGLSSKSPYVFHSASYWGRAVGWYFLALVDILEQMEKANIPSTDSKFTTLKGYLEETATGIKARQDQTTGGWYQILDENSDYSASSYNGKSYTQTYNYIESSATALFTAAYLKAIRLGYLDGATYKTVAEDGYKCLVNQFFSVDEKGKVNIFGSCRSAGLGGKGTDYADGNERFRDGSKPYYLLGYDVAKVEKSENKTEGKVLGAFIMAATEYERANEKAIRFSYDLAPAYDLAQGGSIKAEALGSGAETAKYQWYKTVGTTSTAVTGATTATFYPTESGTYYCEAKSGSTTIKTSTTAVTVEGTDGIENGGTETSKDIFSLTVTYNQVYSLASDANLNLTSEYANVTGGSALVHNGKKGDPADIIYLKNSSSGNIALNGSGGTYVELTLNTPLQEGDVITFTSDENSIGSFYLTKTSTKDKNCSTTDGTYTVTSSDGLANSTKLYVWNNSGGKFKSITITRTGPSLTITTQPKSKSYTVGATTAEALTVAATVKNGTGYTVKYQWYENSTNANTGGTQKSTGESYTPILPQSVGTKYYYCVVTATKSGAENLNATSDVAAITVSEPYVRFTTQPSDANYSIGATATPLSVEATTNISEATISYQWYSNDSESTNDGTPVGTGTSYTPSTENTGTTYYYCVATAQKEGSEPLTATSSIVSVTVANTYSYKVKSGDKAPGINTSKYITTNNDGETGTKLVKMTFGGWRWKGGKYIKPGGTNEITDSWTDSETEEAAVTALDEFKYWFRGTQDAAHEKKDSVMTMYGKPRYGWFVSPKRENGITTDSYPYTLPVRGSFMTFEPTKNGTLTIYILQNGVWNSDTKNKIDIIPGEFRMHAFQITNQRGLVLAEFAPKYSVTNNQKVNPDYKCTNYETRPASFDKTSKDVSDWKEFWDLSETERKAVHDSWSDPENNGCQKIIKLDNGSFLAIQKAVVKYQFHVTGNETYYLFSNFSKMGFSGATFQPDAESGQPQDVTTFSGTNSLSDTKDYTEIAMKEDGTIGETGLTNYKYTINNVEVGKVDGVFIPQFKAITLKRTFKPNQWTTLSLPFNLTQTEVEQIFGTGTQIIVFDKAKITSARTYLTFFYHEIQNVLPGYPYLIRPTLEYDNNNSNSADNAPIHTITDGNLTEFTVYNKAINPFIKQHEFKSDGYTAKCTPSYCTANVSGNGKTDYSMHYENGDIFVSEGDGTVYISGGQSYGKGYRSYIDYTGTTAPAKALSISFSGVEDDDDNGTTTDIHIAELADDVIQTLGIGGVYNLNGQKVADTTRNLPAGIYIVNGRKVVVK